MDVVILAGGKCSPELAGAAGVEDRAMLPVGGRPMVDIVRGAVEHVGRVVQVGGPGGLPAGRTFLESLSAAIGAVQAEEFLLATADLPFLTREAVDDFLARCDRDAMLNYPIVDAGAAERDFPGMKRTTLRLREGIFTGGNIAAVKTVGMKACMPILDDAYRNRKSPLKLGAMVGWGVVARLVVGRLAPASLTIPYLETAVGRFLGAKVHAIRTEFAAIGADIDDLAQYSAIKA